DTQLPRTPQAAEVDDLFRAPPPAPAACVGARRALDEHLQGATDKSLRALLGPALDHLHQPLQAGDLDLVWQLIGQRRGLGSAPGRVEERERGVIADRLGQLERLLEVRLGLARETDDDV